MDLVVDASVVAKWLFQETDSEKALDLRNDFGRGRIELFAPSILHVEVGSVIWQRVARGFLEPADAWHLYDEFELACPVLIEFRGLLRTAMRFAIELERSPYDCLYLALASQKDCDFVTADRKLYNAVIGGFRAIVLLRDWA